MEETRGIDQTLPELRTHELQPAARRAGMMDHVPGAAGMGGPGAAARRLRTIGPGRRELAYLERIQRVESELSSARRELEVAGLVERGSARLLDRIEGELRRVQQQKSRLLVGLGALQRENELLARRARVAEARLARLGGPGA